MKNTRTIVLIISVIMLPFVARAAGLSQPFGGRVLSVKIPSVNCFGAGTGPVVLMSNLSAGMSTLQGGNNIVNNIYGMIPLYTTNPDKIPKPSQWILGQHNLLPSFSTCTIGSVPFPVKKTSTYGVSGGSLGL